MRILVAEDNDDLRVSMQLILEDLGHDVFSVPNGALAVTAALARIPDVVLMDIQMPLMDGLAATRELRRHPVTAKTPIFVISGNGNENWRDQALAAGGNMCMVKPVSYPALVAALQSLKVGPNRAV